MASQGSGKQADVLLPSGWNGTNPTRTSLFTLDSLELHLISGSQFALIADVVGTLRESTYRQQLSGSGNTSDLDGRDPFYDHLVLLDLETGALAGSARLQFIPQATPLEQLPGSEHSYLEHVYPGIKAVLSERQHHVEIGRVALAQRFQRQPHPLMALFRGGLLISSLSGYSTLHGLVSYNHFAFSDTINNAFLSALMRPPYRRADLGLPGPRHPVPSIHSSDQPHSIDNVQALELALRNDYGDEFRLPVLLRQYFKLMGAQVCDLSLAKDFNQITEILMAAEIESLPKERLNYFIDVPHQPIYQHFSWYRGKA